MNFVPIRNWKTSVNLRFNHKYRASSEKNNPNRAKVMNFDLMVKAFQTQPQIHQVPYETDQNNEAQ